MDVLKVPNINSPVNAYNPHIIYNTSHIFMHFYEDSSIQVMMETFH